MNKKIRYLILFFGFLVFLVLAPTIVLYVTGNTIDPETLRPVKTGIIGAKSEPTSAEFFIDDKRMDKTPYNARLIRPGEYNVRLEKEGYFTWSKKLPVWENQITLLAQGVNAVHLIRRPGEPELISDDVADFQRVNGSLWLINNQSLVKVSISDTTRRSSLSLDFAPTRLDMLNDYKYLLASDGKNFAVINTNSDNIFNLPQQGLTPEKIFILPNDNLLLLDGDLMFSYNLVSQTYQSLIDNVLAHTVEGNTAYWQTAGEIFSGQWNNGNLVNITSLVKDENLNSAATSILVTNRKEMFTLIGNTFYRVNLNLRPLNQQTIAASISPYTNEVTFVTGSELWFYNFGLNEPQLLTRSNANLRKFIIRTAIGYGLLIDQDGLTALEIDNRDRQNDYLLVPSETISKLVLGAQDRYVFFLDNNQLKSIIIK